MQKFIRDKCDFWEDTFSNDPDYGVGLEENGDMDGIVAWMPVPNWKDGA